MYLYKFKKDKTRLSRIYTIDQYSQPDFISHKDIQKIQTYFSNNEIQLQDDSQINEEKQEDQMERWSEDSPSYRPKDLEDLIPGYNMSNSFNDTKQSLVVNKQQFTKNENSITKNNLQFKKKQVKPELKKNKKEKPINIHILKRKMKKDPKIPENQIKGTNIIVDSHFPDFPKPQQVDFNTLFSQLIDDNKKRVKPEEFDIHVTRTLTNMQYQIIEGINNKTDKRCRLLYKIVNNPLIELPFLEKLNSYNVITEGNFILRATLKK